jgi:hypothetical protein
LDILTLEDETNELSRKVGIPLPSDAASYPRRKGSSATSLQKPQNSQQTYNLHSVNGKELSANEHEIQTGKKFSKTEIQQRGINPISAFVHET